MGTSRRFEIFLDCLWGFALLAGLLLIPLRFITLDAPGAIGGSALWLHLVLLAMFAYTFSLRLRHRFPLLQRKRKSNEL